MKPINFITPVPPHRQQEYIWWTKITAIALSLTFIIVAIIQIRQFQYLSALKQEKAKLMSRTAAFQDTSKRRDELHKEQKQVQEIMDAAARLLEKPKSPTEHLAVIAGALSSDITLTSYTVHDVHKSTITGTAPDAQAALKMIESLAQSPLFKKTKLTSLKPGVDKNFVFVIEAQSN